MSFYFYLFRPVTTPCRGEAVTCSWSAKSWYIKKKIDTIFLLCFDNYIGNKNLTNFVA